MRVVELPIEWVNIDDASGLVLEIRSPEDGGYRQILGPFSKENMDICLAIVSLKAEEAMFPSSEPMIYKVLPLFPPSSAFLQDPENAKTADPF